MGRVLLFLVALPACGSRRSVVPEANADSDSDVDADSDSDTASEVDPCDVDRDGFRSTGCGGDDCDDADATIHPDAADGAWLDEVVDRTRTDGPSVGIDGAGTLHVAWVEEGTLVYATNGSGDWVPEDVDDRADLGATIAVEADGTPHIAFVEIDGHGRLAVLRAGEWAIQLFADAVEPWSLSLDLDAEGAAHLTYFDDARELVYASFAGAVESTEVVAGEYAGSGTSLAIDSSGSAHVALHADGFSYVTNRSGEWEVARGVAAAAAAALALDPEDGVHAALVGDGLIHATLTAPDEWTFDTVTHEVTGAPHLAIDEDGMAHIAYETASDDFGPNVRYVTNAGGEWRGHVVHSAFAFQPSIAVDADGLPHVVYETVGEGGNEVHHAWPPPPDGIDQDCDGTDG
jgi:hypothetical protein